MTGMGVAISTLPRPSVLVRGVTATEATGPLTEKNIVIEE